MAKIPEKVGKYKILSLIGKGGMGVVYAAEHPTLKRKVILKKLTIRNKQFRERFRLEADTMMDLRSDYIVDMYDHFREGSSWYIAMEFIEGISLEELIKKSGPLDYHLFIYIMYCTVQAIDYIHNRGIIHRDIKPSNIYISYTGDVKLGDFGIASSSSRDVNITDSRSAMGTPSYMAPEQFDDSSSVDSRADIFSLGVTFYESLTGEKPFYSDDFTQLKQMIGRGKYKKLSFYNRNIPFYLKWIIRRCLLVRPGFRFRDMKYIVYRFSRDLKTIGLEKTKNQLIALMDPDKKGKATVLTGTDKKSVKKKMPRDVRLPITLLIILILAIFTIRGGVQKFFFPEIYGAMKIIMVPAADDGKYSIYHVPHVKALPVDKGLFNRKGEVDLILKEGSYNIKIESGSQILWRSVYIPDFKDSKGETITLTILSSPLEQFPLDLSFLIKNRFSQDDITTDSEIYLERNHKWISATEMVLGEMKTGSSYTMKFTHKGYKDSIYRIDTEFYQTSVNLDILLTPESAILKIPAFERGILTINKSDEYFSLNSLKFEKLNIKTKNEQILELLPGAYNLCFELDGKTLEKSINLEKGIEYSYLFE